jgi:hypothetical protein
MKLLGARGVVVCLAALLVVSVGAAFEIDTVSASAPWSGTLTVLGNQTVSADTNGRRAS